MKHILLLGTGGTIACKHGDSGLTPLLTGDELLSYVPAARSFCEVEAIQVLNIDSTNIHPKHWQLLCQVLEENYDNYDGFVICHGTDTMAYTAAAMSYLVQHSKKPIVITGAQKPIDLDVTDARTNLLDSLRFASCERAHGVNIVFDGKVIAGTRGKCFLLIRRRIFVQDNLGTHLSCCTRGLDCLEYLQSRNAFKTSSFEKGDRDHRNLFQLFDFSCLLPAVA